MNSFGRIFRVSIFGESHGPEIGIVIDGVEPGIYLSAEDLRKDIARRKSGAKGTTPRIEADEPIILSGVYNGRATGAPLTIAFKNTNVKSEDYKSFEKTPRPGHADFTAGLRFDEFNDPRGGGHFSGRLTLPVVAAGTVAKKCIFDIMEKSDFDHGITIDAKIVALGGVSREAALERAGGKKLTDSELWSEELQAATSEGDSLGAVVECVAADVPYGVGEPFWDSVESLISHAIFSIPGVRGIEFGDGFKSSSMKGSEHNDPLGLDERGLPLPVKNGSGGMNGGLTNGCPIVFRVAFKPTSSIRKTQKTLDLEKEEIVDFSAPGRHDVCFALRTPVIVESMTAIVLADLLKTIGNNL